MDAGVGACPNQNVLTAWPFACLPALSRLYSPTAEHSNPLDDPLRNGTLLCALVERLEGPPPPEIKLAPRPHFLSRSCLSAPRVPGVAACGVRRWMPRTVAHLHGRLRSHAQGALWPAMASPAEVSGRLARIAGLAVDAPLRVHRAPRNIQQACANVETAYAALRLARPHGSASHALGPCVRAHTARGRGTVPGH